MLKQAATTRTRILPKRLARPTQVAWLLLVGLYVIIFVVGIGPYYHWMANTVYPRTFADNPPLPPLSYSLMAAYSTAIETFIWVLAALCSGLIFLRRADNWMALLMALVLFMLGTVSGGTSFALADLYPQLGGLLTLLWVLPASLIFSALAVFPNGRLVPAWARYVLILNIVWECYRTAVISGWLVVNDTNNASSSLRPQYFLITALFWVLGIAMQWYRYRHVSGQTERQQAKWLLVGAALVLPLLSIFLLNAFGAFNFLPLTVRALIIFPVGYYGSVLMAILALSFSIFRYRLFEVDLALNRSLVYGGVTTLLLMVFLLGGFLLRAVVGESAAFSVSLFGAGLAFNPLRKWARRMVDRRLYGLRFDLRQLAAAHQVIAPSQIGLYSGQQFGAFTAQALIGRGGMSEVYKGLDPVSGQVAALKVVQTNLNNDSIDRAKREAKALAALNHPNIIQFYGLAEQNHLLCLTLELVEGKTLSQHLRENNRPFTLPEAAQYLAGIANALDYVHSTGMVHRDVKASNIMLRASDKKALLMDFGLSKSLHTKNQLTGTEAIGTIDYMAPEQINASREVTYKTDIYALGVVAYELLTNDRPFKGSVGQILFAHLQHPPPDARTLNSSLPESAGKAIAQAMSKDPAERFSNCAAFITALAGLERW
jgi:hypothetical protein